MFICSSFHNALKEEEEEEGRGEGEEELGYIHICVCITFLSFLNSLSMFTLWPSETKG